MHNSRSAPVSISGYNLYYHRDKAYVCVDNKHDVFTFWSVQIDGYGEHSHAHLRATGRMLPMYLHLIMPHRTRHKEDRLSWEIQL
jgi:hypothetical protein